MYIPLEKSNTNCMQHVLRCKSYKKCHCEIIKKLTSYAEDQTKAYIKNFNRRQVVTKSNLKVAITLAQL